MSNSFRSDILTRQLPHILKVLLYIQLQVHEIGLYDSIRSHCNQDNSKDINKIEIDLIQIT